MNKAKQTKIMPDTELTLVKLTFPEKSGYVRKIHHEWDKFFRVNYHQVAANNAIGESHFVQVVDQRVVELN